MDEQRSGQSQYSAANIDDCDAGQDDEDLDDEDYEDDVDDVDDEDDNEEVCQDDASYPNIPLQTPIPWQQKMLQQNRQFQVTLL